MQSLKNKSYSDATSHPFPFKPVAVIGLAILVIVAITLSLHHVFEKAILQEISVMTRTSSRQLDSLTMNLQNFLNSYGMQIFYSPSVRKLREYTNISNYDKVVGLRELGTFATTSDFADTIHVYNGSLGYVYTTSQQHISASSENFYDQAAVKIFEGLKLSDRMRPIRRSYESSLGGHGSSICYSIVLFESDSKGTPDKNAVMINITPEWFNQILLNDDRSIIIDFDGNIIAAHQPNSEEIPAEFLPLITESIARGDVSGYFLDKGGDDRMVYLYSKMAANDWIFIQAMRYSDCMSGLLTLRDNAFTVFFLLISLCLMGIFISLIRIYFPFQRMVRSVAKIKTESDNNSPEALPLTDQLDEFVERSIKMRPAFERMLRERALLALLEHPEQVDAEILGLGGNQSIIILLIHSTDCDKIVNLAQRYCRNAQGAVNDGTTVVMLPSDNMAQAEQFCRECYESYHCRYLYSEPIFSFLQIPQSYQLLLELDMLHCLYPNSSVLCESLLHTRNKESSFSEKDVVTLSSRLKSGNLESSQSLYKHIINTISNDSYSDFLFALNRLNHMTEKLLSECAHSTDKPLELSIQPIEELLKNADNISDLQRYFVTLFIKITQINALNRRAKSRAVVDSVIAIIQKDYADFSLSPRTIADSLGFSNIHLSRQFKAAQGCSVSDYLNRVRIEHACDLLIEEAINVEDIARKVGFENSKYFYVLFKNKTGITPRQYRLEQQK